MDITYETVAAGQRTSWGTRSDGDLPDGTLAATASELLAEIADAPDRLRVVVDEIRIWRGATSTLPTREPDYVQQVTS